MQYEHLSVRHHTISWHTPSLFLLLAAFVDLLSALSRAYDWGVLKGSKLCSWDVTKQHLYSVDLNFNTESFPGIILTRSRETYYIASCSCSWPLLLLLTTAATPRFPPRRAQRRRHSATTCSSPSRRSNPTLGCMHTLCCMPADPQPFAGCMPHPLL